MATWYGRSWRESTGSAPAHGFKETSFIRVIRGSALGVSESQRELPQPAFGLGHQSVFLGFVLREIGHRETQVRPGVVPRHADHRLLVNEELRSFFRVGERTLAASLRGADIKEIRATRHYCLE